MTVCNGITVGSRRYERSWGRMNWRRAPCRCPMARALPQPEGTPWALAGSQSARIPRPGPGPIDLHELILAQTGGGSPAPLFVQFFLGCRRLPPPQCKQASKALSVMATRSPFQRLRPSGPLPRTPRPRHCRTPPQRCADHHWALAPLAVGLRW